MTGQRPSASGDVSDAKQMGAPEPEGDAASFRQPIDPFEHMPDGGVVLEESSAVLGLDDAEGELMEDIDRTAHEAPPGPLEPPTADQVVREDLARALAKR